MKHNAKLAMIGIGSRGVDVSHLHQRQQGEQNQAQHRGGYREPAKPAMIAACLEPVQIAVTRTFRIHRIGCGSVGCVYTQAQFAGAPSTG